MWSYIRWAKSVSKVRRVKDTHREKARSNKTPALTKSTNMDIWVVGNKRFLNLNKIFKKIK